MVDIKLSAGSITRIMRGETVVNPVSQILGYKKVRCRDEADRYRVTISDGVHCHSYAMLAARLNNLVLEGKMDNMAVIRIDKYVPNAEHERRALAILDITILSAAGDGDQPKLGDPILWSVENADRSEHSNADDAVVSPVVGSSDDGPQ